jgi:hypothetical protein
MKNTKRKKKNRAMFKPLEDKLKIIYLNLVKNPSYKE